MNPVSEFFNALITHKNRRALWRFNGADGRILDVTDSTANYVGQSVQLLPPVTAGTGQVTSIINARSENPGSPETITINLSVDTDPVAGNTILPQANIIWGCGGAKFSAIVDVLKGTQLTIAANTVQIDGIYTAQLVGTALPAIRINANLSYGNRGGSSVAPGFTATGTLAKKGDPGDLVSFTIPNFAKDVVVYAMKADGTAASDIDIFWNTSDTSTINIGWISQHEATAPNTVDPGRKYTIPGTARRVAIQNQDGAIATFVTLRFGLAL